eukprot:133655_1
MLQEYITINEQSKETSLHNQHIENPQKYVGYAIRMRIVLILSTLACIGYICLMVFTTIMHIKHHESFQYGFCDENKNYYSCNDNHYMSYCIAYYCDLSKCITPTNDIVTYECVGFNGHSYAPFIARIGIVLMNLYFVYKLFRAAFFGISLPQITNKKPNEHCFKKCLHCTYISIVNQKLHSLSYKLKF